MKRTRGFTLIELMMVVAIIAILAAVAFPSYQNSLIKGRRVAAKAFLMEVVQKEQQFLLDNRSYADTTALTTAGVKVPPEVSRFYDWAATPDPGPPPTFTVRVTPKAGTRQDGDGWMEINEAGAKSAEFPGKTDWK